jgi:hypothetical protein
MNNEEYWKYFNNQTILREWAVEDIEKNSIVDNPANETFVSYFKNENKDKLKALITFSASNTEKHTIRGLVMRSGQWIPRANIDGKGNFGYCYFSKDTVKKMKDIFYSNKLTINHSDDITGDALLINSYLEKNDNCLEWYLEYKVLTTKLWNYIKQNPVGFSIEAFFSAVKLSNE